MRTQNVSKYMLVLALCLVIIVQTRDDSCKLMTVLTLRHCL